MYGDTFEAMPSDIPSPGASSSSDGDAPRKRARGEDPSLFTKSMRSELAVSITDTGLDEQVRNLFSSNKAGALRLVRRLLKEVDSAELARLASEFFGDCDIVANRGHDGRTQQACPAAWARNGQSTSCNLTSCRVCIPCRWRGGLGSLLFVGATATSCRSEYASAPSATPTSATQPGSAWPPT